ncbi:LamG domain-containing protein [Streptomyces sp. NPDC048255]|uniref:LamG domain-containing protein n=1 Tax=Streptomyces sp. NPDC048255 TaxID=3154713 RepID=UPI0033D1903D
MISGVLPAEAAHAAPADKARPAEAGSAEGRRALDEAKAGGRRVEVVGERTEQATVFANPDGMSFTLEQSAVPVRVAKAGGGWQAPDATLVQRADGTVGPKAASVEMRFSGGGDAGPLAAIADGGRSLALNWPGKLPKPELQGATALYRDVLPQVDLRVNATVESFQHVLVVKTPEAAGNPKLKELAFGLETKELTLQKGSSGGLAAVDSDGRTVFRAPPAQMWDSAGKTADEQRRKAAEKPSTLFTAPRSGGPTAPKPSTADAAEVAPSGKGQEPGQGDKVARMDVKVGADRLSVVPDAEMLARSAPSAYPLFIDPTVTWGESERTLLRSDGYESYGWSNGDDDLGKGAGKCGSWAGYACGPGYVQRLYFEFSPAELKGKHVLDATFRVTEPWAFQCDPRWVDLVRTDNISTSTTWSSRPKELDWMGDRLVSAGRGSLCDPNSPDAPIEFNDNPEETNENLTPTVRDFAAGKFSRLTLEIRANDETDTSAWKRFKNDAVLAVKYVALPALPANVGIVTGNGVVCSTDSADPAIVSDPTPAVSGKPRTAAGAEKEANLRIRWRTQKWNGTSWVTAHTDVDSPTSGYAGNLAVQTKSLPTLTEGVSYRLLALTMSYLEDGSNRLNTGYTAACYFKVDPTAPKAPKVTFASVYSECTTNACAPGGGPGVAGLVNFVPAAGDTVNDFQYRLSESAAWTSVCKPAMPCIFRTSIKPERSGTQRLYVRAKDTVGRWGAQQVADFLVAAGTGPVGRWSFDEASGVAKDTATSGVRHDATLAGTAVRDDRGRRGQLTHDANGVPLETAVTDKGLSLDGSGAHAATSGPVLETRSAYTVSAWTRLGSKAQDGIVLSQDGSKYSAFVIWYDVKSNKWVFGLKEKDEDNGQAYFGVVSKAPAVVGAWTHLAGSYDPATQELRFYVNGVLQGTRTVPGSWSSTGPLNMGRYLWAGLRYWHYNGSIDEVAVWQRKLEDKEVADEARLLTSAGFAGAELVAEWSAGNDGATVADTSSGYGRPLTLNGGAVQESGEIVLDGTDDVATAAAPPLDDTGSFTATTAVRLDKAKLLTKDVGYTGQVLGQRTAAGSSWGFWYQMSGKDTVVDMETGQETTVPVGKWHFGRLNADGSFTSVVSNEVASLDDVVRLTGTYDAQSGTVSLYLGHNQNGDAMAYTAQIGTGEFAVGAAFASGAWKNHLPARISEVRLWAGAMASPEQIDAHVGD